ncbi:uncharacterized protein LOC106668897 [Cimex lectularius]|uniref:CCHC-type domain-containing protein n=1 Tax=Cimex lectularius TaxID=79782 RepID=A0A8I6RXJ9_CIMLE|nr:uncharacterized protein LOC106668897 [Cimex lectularius]
MIIHRIHTSIASDSDHKIKKKRIEQIKVNGHLCGALESNQKTAHHIREQIAQYLIEPNNKCPKPAAAHIIHLTDQLMCILNELTIENTFLKGKTESTHINTNNLVQEITKALTPIIENIPEHLNRPQPSTSKNPSLFTPSIINNSEPTSWTTVVKRKLPKIKDTTGHEEETSHLPKTDDQWVTVVKKSMRKKEHPKPAVKDKPAQDRATLLQKAKEEAENSNKIVFIDPREKTDSQEVLKKVKEIINPRVTGIRIDDIRITAKGGVAVKLEAPSDRQALLSNEALSQAGLNTRTAGKRNPRILILRVPKEIQPQELSDQLCANNGQHETWERANVRPLFTLKYGTGTREESAHVSWVVEVDPRTWKAATERGKAYLDYQVCTLKDYTGVTRCYNCQSYGHVAAVCPKKDPVCGICADVHDTRQCPRERTRCVHCHRAGKTSGHPVGSVHCEAHARAIARAWCTTDHGEASDTGEKHQSLTAQGKSDGAMGVMDTDTIENDTPQLHEQ